MQLPAMHPALCCMDVHGCACMPNRRWIGTEPFPDPDHLSVTCLSSFPRHPLSLSTPAPTMPPALQPPPPTRPRRPALDLAPFGTLCNRTAPHHRLRRCSRLLLMERSLEWRHIAPTAPDTLTCYPFHDADPFLLETTPHVYFVGERRAQGKATKGGNGVGGWEAPASCPCTSTLSVSGAEQLRPPGAGAGGQAPPLPPACACTCAGTCAHAPRRAQPAAWVAAAATAPVLLSWAPYPSPLLFEACCFYSSQPPFRPRPAPPPPGNQPEFGTRLLRVPQAGGGEAVVRLVAVPSFASSGTIVLLNLRTLQCHPVHFDGSMLDAAS